MKISQFAGRQRALFVSIMLATVLILTAVQMLMAAQDDGVAVERDGKGDPAALAVVKSVDQTEAVAGSTLEYTVSITNVGGSIGDVVMTDTLPMSVTFQSFVTSSLSATGFILTGFGHNDGVVTMTGQLGGGSNVSPMFSVVIDSEAMVGMTLTNQAYVTGTGALLMAEAATVIVDEIEPPAELAVTKSVDEVEASPGASLQYTVGITNIGSSSAEVMMVDTLPPDIIFQQFVTSSLSVPGFVATGYGHNNGTVTVTGQLADSTAVQVMFDVMIDEEATGGITRTNMVTVTAPDVMYTAMASTAVLSPTTVGRTAYLPLVFQAIPIPTLSIVRDGLDIEWTVSWQSNSDDVTGYELQESTDPDFATPSVFNLAASTTSREFTHIESGVYYYRVRNKVNSLVGPWSVVREVRNLQTLTLEATRPNSDNEWTLSWENSGSTVMYQLQESKKENFSSGVTTYEIEGDTPSKLIDKTASTENVYYYRVRIVAGSSTSDWSDTVQVVGGYRDDFTDDDSGWAIRRTTFLEEVRSWYEIDSSQDKHWFIIQVEDSWDWGIASPLMPAPEPPYEIRYRAKIANQGNLVSTGAVFGGDWNGEDCPDYSSLEGVYDHNICFNHFYNVNTIWFGPLKILFERVDELVWCPSCGGSPMKRLGDIDANDAVEVGGNPDGWNDYRVVVREDEIKIYVAGVLEYTYDDTRYIDDPYFGVFASTDEYSNSTWRFEYYQVMPLDD